MSEKKLYIRFLDSGVESDINMYWSDAPETCKVIWGALAEPIRVPAAHAIFSGPEIMMGLPESAQNFDPVNVPRENQTILPQPGELLWFYQPKNFFKGMTDEFWEIGMFYGPGGRTFGPTGWIPCNYFGRVAEAGLEAIAAECAKTRTEGLQQVEIGRR